MFCSAADRPLVAGNDARGEDRRVALPPARGRDGRRRRCGQRGARLALAAGADEQDLVARQIAGLLLRDAASGSRAGSRIPAPPRPCAAASGPTAPDARPAADAAMGDALEPRHIGGEAGRPRPGRVRVRPASSSVARIVASEPASPSTNTLVRVADHGEHALVADAAQRRLVGDLADQRLGIDLPVAGVQHRAERRADRQRIRLGDRMGHGDQLELERPDGELARPAGSR